MAYRGRPIISLRMPREQIQGLQILARQQGRTVSDILRELVEQTLKENHIRTAPEQLDGQLSV